jgi:hypothetical protein
MKYWFGALCVLFGAWMVFRALVHRRTVIAARERAAALGREPQPTLNMELQALRTGCAPIFLLAVVLLSLVMSAMWFVMDQEGNFSILDILGFLFGIFAYVFSMLVRLQYSALGLDTSPAD